MTGPGGFLEPFERLVTVTVLGRRAAVPENNPLLRCFQFLSPEDVAMGSFCWNGDCGNCEITLERGGERTAVRSCQTLVRENDAVIEASPELRRALEGWLRRG